MSRFRVPGPVPLPSFHQNDVTQFQSDQSASLSGKELDPGTASNEPILCILEDERYLLNYDD